MTATDVVDRSLPAASPRRRGIDDVYARGAVEDARGRHSPALPDDATAGASD